VSTIKDVAEAAGVSIATVSRALHGLPRVSEATRQRVLAAAADLRYVASPSAASLASGQTNAIGVVAPFVNRWYFAAIVHSAEERLRKAGYDLLLYSLGTDAQERRRAFSGTLLRKRVDAVLVLGLHPTAEEVAALSTVGGPVAIVGADVPGWASVHIDDRGAARCAVRHLLDLGHRRIGVVGGPLDSLCARERLEACRAAMETAGVPVDPQLIRTGRFWFEDGLALGGELLGRPRRPTAVLCGNDLQALGVYEAARMAGLRVPRDLSVVGFDGIAATLWCGPPMTTVCQPFRKIGAAAADLLLALIAGEQPAQTRIELPTTLAVRASTAAPPAQ
jgi:LacI family transcriptional regulator, repressor for deo operon, udp, cdd, tsx, nupC, and nupG